MHRNLSIDQSADGTLAVKDIGDPMEFYEASLRFYKERRPVKQGARQKYPDTTNGEVRQLAKIWSKLQSRILRGDFSEDDRLRREWREALVPIAVATTMTDPNLTFPQNELFWSRWTKRQAIYLSAVHEMPTKRAMIVASVKESVTHLPENLGRGAKVALDASQRAVHATAELAGGTARSLFGGLFSGLGTPLLIGAAVVGGIILVPKLLPQPSPGEGVEEVPS